MKDMFYDMEDAPLEDFDPVAAGDEVAYEDEQQEMFEHYRFDIAAGQVPMRVDKYLSTHMEYTSRHRIQLAMKAASIRAEQGGRHGSPSGAWPLQRNACECPGPSSGYLSGP